MTRGAMPPEPHGDHVVSEEVLDHTAVQAFKNASCAFAVCVDDEKGCVWIARRGRTPDLDRATDVVLAFAFRAANTIVEGLADSDGPRGSLAPPDGDQ